MFAEDTGNQLDEVAIAPPMLRDSQPQAHHVINQQQQQDTPNSKVIRRNNTNSPPTRATGSPYAAPIPGVAVGGAFPSSGLDISPKVKKAGNEPNLSRDSVSQLRTLEMSAERRSRGARNNLTQTQKENKKKGGDDDAGREQSREEMETQRQLQEEEEDIQALVEAQREAAQKGRFLEAHKLQRQVRMSAQDHQHHVENDMHYSKMQAILGSREVTHSHREKLMIFTTEWEKQLGELEKRAAEERNELATRHQRELAEQEEIIRSQIANRWLGHKSKNLTEAQQTTERLASQQFYYEAHQAQKYSEKLESAERLEQEKKFQRELTRRMNVLRTTKAKEMAALEARIDSAREALLTQRARDYEVLVLKQFNKQVTEEQRVRVEFGQRRTAMSRKMVGVQTRLAKKVQLPAMSKSGGSRPGSNANSGSNANPFGKVHSQSNMNSMRGSSSSGANYSASGRKRLLDGLGSSSRNSPTSQNNINDPLLASSSSAQQKKKDSLGGNSIFLPSGIDYSANQDKLPLPIVGSGETVGAVPSTTNTNANSNMNAASSNSVKIPRPPSK